MDDIIAEYLEALSANAFQQGSREWLANRSKSVGCSELFKATHTKSSTETLIKEKLSPSNLNGVTAIIWGKSYEDTIKKYVEIILDCKVHTCPGSVIGQYGITCSADGLASIKVPAHWLPELLQYRHERDYYKIVRSYKTYTAAYDPFTIADINSDASNFLLALLEFKCPISRKLGCKIPDLYVYQVLGGLNILRAADFGLYCEGRFCVCELDMLAFDDRHVLFDNNKGRKEYEYIGYTPLMIGCKFFIFNEDIDAVPEMLMLYDNYDTFKYNFSYGQSYTTVDLCCMPHPNGTQKSAGEFIAAISSLDILSQDETEQLSKLVNQAMPDWQNIIALFSKWPKRVFAAQPWKLFDYAMFRFYKLASFIDAHAEAVEYVLAEVNKNANY